MRVINNLNDLKKDEEIIKMIPKTKEIRDLVDDYDTDYTEETITQFSYLVKNKYDNEILKDLKKFILKYQGNGIIKSMKSVNSYKIFKAFNYYDLLNQLKEFEENLSKSWKIISDLNEEEYGNLKVYYVEVAQIDNNTLNIF